MAPLIGYYAHHHGSGHRIRAELVAREYPGEVAVLGTHPDATVPLPPDDDGVARPDAAARGAFHWAPRHNPLLAPRALALLEWIRDCRPALVVVDVSVEVAVQVRLSGVPVVVVRQHGLRTDATHELAHRVADGLLAPYPAWAEDPSASASLRHRTFYAGGFSRFEPSPSDLSERDPEEVVVVVGRGGTGVCERDLHQVAAAAGRRWTVCGMTGSDTDRVTFLGRDADVRTAMSRAGAVVVSAGHSALCEAAAAGAPTIAIAEDRPFAEQEHKVAVLAERGAVRPAPPWSDPTAWTTLLDEIVLDPPVWRDFVRPHAARHAARYLAQLASDLSRSA
jgi:UDP-N-acetylglucosamine--N-acetylmuramyl-(pentapeptide) pyrophosphoryl-undecaprenol N-acetylglucosamine transferase